MAPRALRLGTRRSALARAQSGLVARRLMQLHPGLAVELVGIDTRGDRILDQPLAAIEGKEFFTAEIDAALLDGSVDLSVHSYKDLSLERPAAIHLAAVPVREQPRDIVLFAPDVFARLAAGAVLRIGSSSPRRAAFVPEFLRQALPRRADTAAVGVAAADADAGAARVELRELRGNVDTRLRRLREPAASERRLDGVVLAFAGLARLWRDSMGHELLQELLADLPRMVLPLSVCPAAPAQGALAVECRAADAPTLELLRVLDDPATRADIAAERELLAARGGGCHQRFGATRVTVPGLGALLYTRAADDHEVQAPRLQWSSAQPLPAPVRPVRAWDGTRAPRAPTVRIEAAEQYCRQQLGGSAALFVAHRQALPDMPAVDVNGCRHIWVPGTATWFALAQRGVWVEGCADGLGFGTLQSLLAEGMLQLPALADWTILTYEGAQEGWNAGRIIATYRAADVVPAAAAGVAAAVVRNLPAAGSPGASGEPGMLVNDCTPADATHIFWASSAQFERWRGHVRADAYHASGPGKTYDYLRRQAFAQLSVFPTVQQWREWLEQ